MKLKPKPINQEVTILPHKTILCKTDTSQIIEYANEYFIQLCEYTEGEIIGESIALLYHPQMPRTILNLAYKYVLNKKKVYSIARFISKSGKFFWLQIRFDFKVNQETREIQNIYLYGNAASRQSITTLTKIYDKLDKIEKESNIEIAQKYFKNYLESKNLSYDSFFNQFLTL